MNSEFDVIVIGGGQAGLASGYHLQRNHIEFVILESQPQAVGSWPRYYDSLKLFSPAQLSSLPGMKFPGEPKRYPLREEVIAYFKAYKEKFKLPVKTDQDVLRVEKANNRFIVHTAAGETYCAQAVINATGSFQNPYRPAISGHEMYQGTMMHSSEYHRPQDFAGQRVIVVGRGNSAVQIAVELAEVSHTSLAVLKPVQFTKQRVGGRDIHFLLRATGFDTFPFWRFGISTPNPSSVIDLDRYQERLQAGKPDQRQMFTSFYSDGVIWPDGRKEKVDAVVFATGYRPGLDHLSDLRALDENGLPKHRAGVSLSVPELYYVGLYGQRSFASATIRGVGSDARYIVRKLKQGLRKS